MSRARVSVQLKCLSQTAPAPVMFRFLAFFQLSEGRIHTPLISDFNKINDLISVIRTLFINSQTIDPNLTCNNKLVVNFQQ